MKHIVPADPRPKLIQRRVWQRRLIVVAILGLFVPPAIQATVPAVFPLWAAAAISVLITITATLGSLLCRRYETPRKVKKATWYEPPVIHLGK